MDSAVALLEQPPPERAFPKAPLKFLTIDIIANKTAQICHHHDLQISRLIELAAISYDNSWVLNFRSVYSYKENLFPWPLLPKIKQNKWRNYSVIETLSMTIGSSTPEIFTFNPHLIKPVMKITIKYTRQ